MKITALEIVGYGVWSGLKVQRLTDGLNVVYGPNEAGKTTLLHFIRSVLYGFSPERCRYFPPVHGGRPGGWMEVAGPAGNFQIDRYQADGRPDADEITITAADGTRQGEHVLKTLLYNVDEPIFKNVFAVGLREIQELATLGDTQAAELLYNLTAGLDRVSIVEVMRELETLRNRILDPDGGPCLVVQLLADRERLRREIEDLASLTRHWGRLAAEQSQLDREVSRLEEERARAGHQIRVAELAIALRERWARRGEFDQELSALGSQGSTPADAVARLDALNARIQSRQDHIERLDRQRQELRQESAGLEIHDPLARQAARIEALGEQGPWIRTVQEQVREIESDIAALESALAAEHQRVGLDRPAGGEAATSYSPRMLARLRSPGRTLRHCQERVGQARQEAASAQQTAQSLGRQIEAALSARGERDMAAAIDRAGNLVAQLRRRVQVDERLDQMARYQAELEEQNRRFLERQILPAWVLVGLGAVFVLGAVLVMAGLFMPASVTGSLGWLLAGLGVVGIGAAGIGKVMIERSNARQLDACQKQVNMLQLQIKQANEERDTLDGQLPRGGGPLVSRLAAAEKELADLEELMPLDTRRAAAGQEAASAQQRATQAEQEMREARRRWRDALAATRLPAKYTLKQVKQLARRCEHMAHVERRLVQRREELAQRRREFDMLAGRISQLATECGVAVGPDPVAAIQELVQAIARQQVKLTRREAIQGRLRQIRHARARCDDSLGHLKRRRRDLLRRCGAGDEQELRRRAVEAARADVLRHERDALDREITAAIGGHCPPEVIRQQIEVSTPGSLEKRREEMLARLAAIDKELRERLENRGRIAAEMKALAEDRQLPMKQLELAALQKRLDGAIRRWQVLAVTYRVLDDIRKTYEHERQPETLREASGYLEQLTQGRYCRVWTPLGESVLRVDDAQGHSLPVEMLSRGTREQLFLSLRLALGACYGRRGAPLPLVLDDVLVNFDAQRAKAAASVLRDFAAAGHQLLVFTCHEHIAKLFKSLRVPVSDLPDRAEGGAGTLVFDEPLKEKPKRTRSKPPTSRKPAKPKPPEPEEDLPDDEEEDFAEEDFAEEDREEEEDSSDDADLWEEEDSSASDEEDDAEEEEDDDLADDEEEDEEALWKEEDETVPLTRPASRSKRSRKR